jgi:hypothetical protein
LYRPSFASKHEETLVKSKSPELGTSTYWLVGTEKPPQVFSLIIIETMIGTAGSGSADVVNPLPYKMSHLLVTNSESIGALTLPSK